MLLDVSLGENWKGGKRGYKPIGEASERSLLYLEFLGARQSSGGLSDSVQRNSVGLV